MTRNEALSILGLSGEPSEEEIKKSYKKLAIENHPDKHKGSKDFEEKFKKIQSAYTFLTEPQSQAGQYGGFSGDPVFEQMAKEFNATFGFNARSRQREQYKQQENPCDKKIQLPDANIGEYLVTFNQLIFKEDINLNLEVQACCSSCLSNNKIWYMCSSCNGIGKINQSLRTPIGVISQVSQCSICTGLGWIKNNHCTICSDRLVYLKKKNITFRIPDNFVVGSTIRLVEKGNEGWNVPNSAIFIEPKIRIPSISNLTEEERNILKTLLNK